MKKHPLAVYVAQGVMAFVIGALVLCPPPLAPCPMLSAQELKIGFVNLGEVFDGYAKTQARDADLEKKGKKKEAELKGRMDELTGLRKSLELLSDDARESRVVEIERKTDDLQRFRTNTARDLRRERDKIAKGIFSEIQEGLNEYAKANGYAFILDSQALLYGQGGHDVTNEVLSLLNQRAQ